MLRRDGTGLVETGAHDMGQGAWTVFAQIAADSLGLDVEQVEFRAGSSDLPDAGIAGGSGHATAGSAIQAAGEQAIARDGAGTDRPRSVFGAGNVGVVPAMAGWRWDDENRGESSPISSLAPASRKSRGMAPGRRTCHGGALSMQADGAVFAEVKVDPELGQIRATRLVGAFAAGRIINPRLVRSQYYGGMIWGVSFALHERAALDPRTGRVMNADLAEYHVPVNADVPSLEAILVEEDDPHVNALGIKGVGEIGITGTAGAIANAVWHATGIRVRHSRWDRVHVTRSARAWNGRMTVDEAGILRVGQAAM